MTIMPPVNLRAIEDPSGERWVQGSFIIFRRDLLAEKGKTQLWFVLTMDQSMVLGNIRWFGRWKKYAFFPNPETVYERTCLREIADFCEYITEFHKYQKEENK